MVTGFGSVDAESNTEEETLRKYAALKMIDVLKKTVAHESLVKIAAYVLSEFGYLIASEPEKGH